MHSSQTGLAQECQGYTHRYASINDVTVACVNFYDVHGGGKFNSGKFQLVNGASEITVDGNGDNSIQTNAFNVLAGANCTGPVIPARIDHTTAQTGKSVGDTITDTATLVNVGTRTLYVQFHLYAPGDAQCTGTDQYNGGRIGRTGDGDVTSAPQTTTQAGDYHWTAQLYDAQTGGNLLGSTKCNDPNETSSVLGAAIDVAKTADNPSVSAGDTIGFTITVTNNGAGTAKGVSVNDTLPTDPGTSWSINGGTYGGFTTCGISGGVLTCGPSDLAPGASYTIHITSPTTGATAGTSPVDNTANVTTTNDSSDTASASVEVLAANIGISKIADPAGPVSAGDDIGFDVVVTNTGPGTAYNVVVSDNLPAGADLDWSLSPAYPGCSVNGAVGSQTLDCSFASILAGGSEGPIHVTSHTTKDDAGTVTNTAVVTTSNDGTKEDTATVEVQAGNPTTDTAQTVHISDDAQVNSLIGTGTACAGNPDPNCGTVTFELINGADCTGPVIFSDTQALDPNTHMASTDGFTVDANGTYSWHVVYNGDNNNNPSPANCDESTTVAGNAFTP